MQRIAIKDIQIVYQLTCFSSESTKRELREKRLKRRIFNSFYKFDHSEFGTYRVEFVQLVCEN